MDDENDHAVIEGGNSVVSTCDATCHAEMNVVRMACQDYTKDFLRNCTLYTSTEPCAMYRRCYLLVRNSEGYVRIVRERIEKTREGRDA